MAKFLKTLLLLVVLLRLLRLLLDNEFPDVDVVVDELVVVVVVVADPSFGDETVDAHKRRVLSERVVALVRRGHTTLVCLKERREDNDNSISPVVVVVNESPQAKRVVW